ncbi:MAG: nucleotidyltransferase [Syntrophomonadaceae bacterium]|nr:nucleotidyltransferase [Syntrophomonadaceae bacterium]
MQVLAIIAEYNPFHHGHRYLIQAASENYNFDGIMCVMSPDFVQRGEAALCSKWARTQMALQGGVDLVIQLPFVCAVRSAYYFARGAMELIAQCGVASHLAFGSESGDLYQLQYLARIIAGEPEEYKGLIKKYLASGLSFAAARAKALHNYVNAGTGEIESLLWGPNNILALEYLRSIYELGLAIQPLTIKRKGPDYHDTQLSQLSSATAIRQALFDSTALDNIAASMPESSWEILKREISLGQAPISSDLLETAILSRLRTMDRHEIRQIYEVSEGLENRIYEAARSCGTLADLRQYIKSRRYSMTRINRILLYSLLGISQTMMTHLDQHGPSYLHVLGFSPRGREILQQINSNSRLPVLNRGKDIKRFYEENRGYPPGTMLELDIKAADIYRLLMPNPQARTGGREFTTSPLRV